MWKAYRDLRLVESRGGKQKEWTHEGGLKEKSSRNRRHPTVNTEAYDCMWKHSGEIRLRFLSCVDKNLFYIQYPAMKRTVKVNFIAKEADWRNI